MINARIEIDVDEIMDKHQLKGQAQKYFTQECVKAINLYVPYKSGTLKDLDVTIGETSISYFAPYAKKQYYTNKGNGIGGVNKGGLRGPHWDKRMWNDKQDEILDKVCSKVGGRRV